MKFLHLELSFTLLSFMCFFKKKADYFELTFKVAYI